MYFKATFLMIFKILFLLMISVESGKISGPSDYIVKTIENCDQTVPQTIYADKYRLNKYNRTIYSYNGNVTMLDGLSDDTVINMTVEVWGNGGWKQNFLSRVFKNACSSLKRFFPEYTEFIFELAKIDGCPIPPGTYELKNVPIKFNLGFAMPYGRFRATNRFIDNGKLIYCFRLTLDIEPKIDEN